MHRKIRRYILFFSIISIVAILSYYLYEAYGLAQGVLEVKDRRDKFFKEKGITLDSMGNFNKIPVDSMGYTVYRDYIIIKDSLDQNNQYIETNEK